MAITAKHRDYPLRCERFLTLLWTSGSDFVHGFDDLAGRYPIEVFQKECYTLLKDQIRQRNMEGEGTAFDDVSGCVELIRTARANLYRFYMESRGVAVIGG